MISTTCRWCNREINVHNFEPFSNEYLEKQPIICHPCRVAYEAGWLRRLIQRRILGNEKQEEKEADEYFDKREVKTKKICVNEVI